MSAVGRASAAAAIGGLLSAAALAAFFLLTAEVRTGFDVDPPRLMTGVYPAERDSASGLTFAWTGPEVALRVPGLDRRVEWVLELRARAARPRGLDNPSLLFYVDGVQVHAASTAADFADIRVRVPLRPERRGVLITVRASSTFVPGGGDRRELGVMLDQVRLTPAGVVLPPADTFAGAATSGAALGAAVALVGVTPGSAIGAAVLLGAGQAGMLSRGFAPYTRYAVVAARLGIVIGVALVVLTALIQWRRGRRLRNTARFAIAFSAGALFLKLLVLLHPDLPLGDALFQAHRFQAVLRGNLYFTSIAPGNYMFPYAPGLYVAAAPFAALVTRELGDVALLRIVAACADAIAAGLVYFIVARGWSDRLAGAIAAALYHLIPLGYRVIVGGNLTNSFAQSLSVVALAVIAAPSLRWERPPATALLTIVLAAAFMSHTSTFAILAVTAPLVAVLFFWRGGPALRSPALAVLAGGLAAVALAIVLYYGHFVTTYRTELARIGTETAAAAPDAGGRGIIGRLGAAPRYLLTYLTAPVLLLAAAGAAALWRRSSRDRLTLSVAGWGVACVLFLALGILTPVDMRYYLAAIPAVAIAAGYGASAAWAAGGTARIAAALTLAWAVWIAIGTWWRSVEG